MFVEANRTVTHTLEQIANLSEVIENNDARIKALKTEAAKFRKMTVDAFDELNIRNHSKNSYLSKIKSEIYGCEESIKSFEAYKAELINKLAA